MQYDIEAARHADFLDIAALDRIAWEHTGEPFIADGEHVWRVWCEHAHVFVARQPGGGHLIHSHEIAGALVMFPTVEGELFLHKIMVHPQVRGKGVGTKLMYRALGVARQPVLLTVDPINKHAVSLYENVGFAVREEVPGYYRPHEDRLVMVYRPGKIPS